VTNSSKRVLAVALAAVFLGALDLTVITTILPDMVTDLRINAADVDRYVWIINSYLIAYLVAIPVFGRASDIVGRKRAIQVALGLFLVGSVWCALANDLPAMVTGRVIQGAGGGALLPVTLALVSDLVPRGRRAAMLGLVGAVDTLGWVLGPFWGALITALAHGGEPWRWVFFLNMPAAIAILVVVSVASEADTADRAQWWRRLDLLSALLLAAALLSLNLGLSAGGELGSGPTGSRPLGGSRNPAAAFAVPLVVAGFVLIALLIWRQSRTAFPLIPSQLSRNRLFLAALTTNFLVGASLIVAMADVPVIVALISDPADVSRLSALLLAPFTVSIALLSFAGGRISDRLSPRWTASLGLILIAVGYALLWFGLRGAELRGMAPGLVVAGAGFGLVFAPISASAVDAAAEADRGIAAALALVARLLGMTLGISLLTGIAVHRLQGLVGNLDAIQPEPGEATSDFLARQTTLLYELVLPISLQVARETFLLAGLIALLALVVVRGLSSPAPSISA
jgi:MFS family permease